MSHQDTRWANKAAQNVACGRPLAGAACSTYLAAVFAVFSVTSSGCGARGEGLTDSDSATSSGTSSVTSSATGSAPAPAALALYVSTQDGCAEPRPVSTATAELTPQDSGQGVDVVELFHQDECTGAGGQHIIARSLEDGFSEYWLGGHACYFFSTPGGPLPASPAFGVIRYNSTAALFQLPPELCLGFPGEPYGLETSLITEAVGVFATLDGAQAFAASVQAGMP